MSVPTWKKPQKLYALIEILKTTGICAIKPSTVIRGLEFSRINHERLKLTDGKIEYVENRKPTSKVEVKSLWKK